MMNEIKKRIAYVFDEIAIGEQFYYGHKCYTKNELGEIEEVPGAPVKKKHEIVNSLHKYCSDEIKDVVRIGCKHNGSKYHSAETKVKKKNLGCIKGDYPHLYFDFSALSLTHSLNGVYMEGLPNPVICNEPWEGFRLTWDPSGDGATGLEKDADRLVMVLFNVYQQRFYVMENAGYIRGNQMLDFYVEGAANHHRIEGWAFFVSKCGKYVSGTTYLGGFSKDTVS